MVKLISAEAFKLNCEYSHAYRFGSARPLGCVVKLSNSTKADRHAQHAVGRHDAGTITSVTLETPRVEQPAPEVAEVEDDQVFQWTKQWYPVAVVNDLDPSKPHSIMLLGEKLVLWRDGNSNWACFKDSCPHRQVPLSEGRIEETDGTLMCGYHGWRFGADGTPTYIPQISVFDKKAEALACSNSRACAKVHPTQVKQELVWVWAESSPTALEESKQKDPIINEFREDNPDGYLYQYHNYVRDLPGGLAVWVENSCDQSHVAFAHHGLVGQRGGEKEGYFTANAIEMPADDPFSFAFDFDFSSNGERVSTVRMKWRPPSQMLFTLSAFPTTQLWINLVPVSPTCTKIIINSGATKVPIPELLKKLRTLPVLGDLFTMVGHLQMNAVNDGDAIFMHEQFTNISQSGKGIRTGYYMPSDSDKCVAVWHRWLATKGGGGPPFSPNSPTEPMWDSFGKLKRETILDRYHQHTRHCSVCSKALRRVRAGQKVAVGALGALFLAAAATLGRGASVTSVPFATITAGAVFFAWLLASLRKLESSFVFKDWRQPDLKPIKNKKKKSATN